MGPGSPSKIARGHAAMHLATWLMPKINTVQRSMHYSLTLAMYSVAGF